MKASKNEKNREIFTFLITVSHLIISKKEKKERTGATSKLGLGREDVRYLLY